jgi:hypothetical protein
MRIGTETFYGRVKTLSRILDLDTKSVEDNNRIDIYISCHTAPAAEESI